MANEKQKNYWTNLVGKKWMAMSDEMEQRFAGVSDAVMQQTCLKTGEDVIDIGCGTGSTSLAAARLVGLGGQVRGVDVSEVMLQAAKRLATKFGVLNLDFMLADAQTDSFNLSANVFISRFGVMFFEDPIKAFSNFRRNAAPGARLSFAAWAPLSKNEHWQKPLELARKIVGDGIVRRPYAPSPLAFSDADYVRSILVQSGWKNARVEERRVDLIGDSFEREAEIACILGPSGALLEEKKAGESELKKAEEAFLKHLPNYADVMPDGRVRLPSTINMITATI